MWPSETMSAMSGEEGSGEEIEERLSSVTKR